MEAGIETQFANRRASLALTHYRRRSKDVHVATAFPPSPGPVVPVASLGTVENNGWELLVAAQLVDRRAVVVDAAFSASTNANELTSLGKHPPVIDRYTRLVEGYPLFGWWAQRIVGWDDKDGNGILTYNNDPALNEVFVADSVTFRGYAQPPRLATATFGVTLLDRRLRLQSRVDYRGGHRWFNQTAYYGCVSNSCAGLMHPGSSLEEQAAAVAVRDHPARTLDEYFEKGDAIRWRELAIQYSLARSQGRTVFRARTATVALAARNIKHWTAYRGVDPETDYSAGASGNLPGELLTLGPPTYYTLRFNLTF